MTFNSLGGFVFEFVQKTGPRTLLLLHGTGGSEVEILKLGEKLDENACLIAPRGKVREEGMNRFFERNAPGMFNRADLKQRTEELSQFIIEMEGRFSAPSGSLVGVGYSNGANILLHMHCLYPNRLRAAILFRPMMAALADDPPTFSRQPILISAGANDMMVPDGDAEQLAALLEESGADVTLNITNSGHAITSEDISAAREWLNTNT